MAQAVTEMHDVEARQYLPGCFQVNLVSVVLVKDETLAKHTKPSCADPRIALQLVRGLARRLPLSSHLLRSAKRLHGPVTVA